MTVGELITLLDTYPRDLRVVVSGYEDSDWGFDDLQAPRLVRVVEHEERTFQGAFAEVGHSWDPEEGRPQFDALALPR